MSRHRKQLSFLSQSQKLPRSGRGRADVLHDFHVTGTAGQRAPLSCTHKDTPVGTPQSQLWPGVGHHHPGNADATQGLQVTPTTSRALYPPLSLWLKFLPQPKTQEWQISIYFDSSRTGRKDFLNKYLFKIKTLPSRSVFSVCGSHTYQDVCECSSIRKSLPPLGLIQTQGSAIHHKAYWTLQIKKKIQTHCAECFSQPALWIRAFVEKAWSTERFHPLLQKLKSNSNKIWTWCLFAALWFFNGMFYS